MAVLGEPEDLVLLSATEGYQDERGAFHEGTRTERHVICQTVIYGALTRAQLRSSDVRIQNVSEAPYVGFITMAVVEMWTLDYEGEDQAIYRGEEVQVEVDTNLGPRTTLILRKRIGNDGASHGHGSGDDGG